MVESRACKFYATAVGYSCCRTPLLLAQRRSAPVSLHFHRHNHFHYGSLTHIVQRTSACKLQSICNSLRLGAAEEGESSWQDKLDSTSTKKGELLEGEPEIGQSDHIVDEEGNIDNIEQEQTRSPDGEDEAGSLDQSGRPQHPEAAGSFTPTSSNIWPGEGGIKEGDKGEANVGSVHIDPSHSQQAEISPAEFQEHQKYGSSESTCDEGSLSKSISLHIGYGGGSAKQKKRVEEGGPEEVFRVDDGRTPDDYQRRADLFGRSGEESVAQKQKNESIQGLIETQCVGFIKRVPFWG